MKYKRVLLKLSGESLGGNEGRGIDEGMLARYAAEVAQAVRSGVQVAIVVGGGNIFAGRHRSGRRQHFQRTFRCGQGF